MQRVGHQVLKNGTFESSQISLQNVGTRTCSQHLDEQSDVSHIHFEHVVLGISLYWQACDVGIVTAADDTSILQPLQRAQVGLSASARLHLIVLELLVLLRLVSCGVFPLQQRIFNLPFQHFIKRVFVSILHFLQRLFII